jgi:predicted RNA-binding protein with PUA-like domain
VASNAYPDPSQFDPDSRYFDPKATGAQARWISVDMRAVRQGSFLPLSALRAMPELAGMALLAKGSRLSITPVQAHEWDAIVARLGLAHQK